MSTFITRAALWPIIEFSSVFQRVCTKHASAFKMHSNIWNVAWLDFEFRLWNLIYGYLINSESGRKFTWHHSDLMTAFWIYTVFSYLDFIRLFFSVNFVKFLRTCFSQNVSCWLFLSVTNCILSRCLISIIIINHFDIKMIILTSFSFSFDTPELFFFFV